MPDDQIGLAGVLTSFSFSEGSGGTTTDAAGGRIGVLKGAAGFTAEGREGAGLGLAATGAFLEVAHDPAFALAEGTLAIWVRPDAIGKLQGVVGKDARDFGAGGHLSVHVGGNGVVRFRLESATVVHEVAANRPLAAGDWAHVAVSWGAQGMRLYLDGDLVGQGAYAGGLLGNAEPWAIGAYASNSAALSSKGVQNFFRGALDEFVVFDRQIEPQGIAALMDPATPVNAAPVIDRGVGNQTAAERAPFVFFLPGDAFADPDNDPLILTATLADGGALPAWLDFDGAAFSGTPPSEAAGTLALRVTASDGRAATSDDFLLIIGDAGSPPSPVTAALTSFSFSEGSGGTTTDAAGGRIGVLKGAAGFTAEGREGAGLGLAATGAFLEVAHDPAFALAEGTLAIWVRPDAIGKLQGVVGKDARDFGAGGHLSVHVGGNGVVRFRLESATVVHEVAANRPLAAGDWAHVAVSWGAQGMRLYLDGELVGQGAYAGGLLGNAEPWAIGAYASNSAALSSKGVQNFFRGALDEFVVFDRQIEPQDIAAGGLLSFAGQTDRAKTIDLEEGVWADAPRVVPLGDSNTLGTTNLIADASLWSGYRGELWSLVTAGGHWMDYVGDRSNGPAGLPDPDHRGVSGIRATRIAELAEGITRTHRPDVVLLMLGSTDAQRLADPIHGEPEDAVPAALLSIMQSIDAVQPGVTILLAPLPPVDPETPGYTLRPDAEAVRSAINAQLPQVLAQAQALGIDARLVPMNALSKADLYDGSHLTPEGHAKIAAAWLAALDDGLSLVNGDFGGPRTPISGVRDVHGSELGDYLRGNAAANKLDGRTGADRIEGGGGADIMTGGLGADVFVYRGSDEVGDRIVDFTPSVDRIEFAAAGFGDGSVILRSGAAPTLQGAAGQFLYGTLDGRLRWDPDGTGPAAPVLIATLDGAPALTSDDFQML